MEFSFHLYNKLAADGVSMAVDKLLRQRIKEKTRGVGMRSADIRNDLLQKPPVVVCIGSDLAVGDSLGPIVGSMLKYKTQGLHVYVYGTLALPVTAKEIKYMRSFLKETHAGEQIIAVDAAVGAEGDIGLMRVNHSPLYPGAGANKRLGAIGDLSILGIVAEKSISNFALLNSTRLNLVYSMAEKISDALATLLWQRKKNIHQAKQNV
jgi:putative sporulation protein YyaC